MGWVHFKTYLRVPLLLEVRDNALTNEVRVFDDLEHLVVIPFDQSHFKPVLGGIDVKHLWLCLPVKAVYVSTLDLGEVNRLIQRTDDSVVTSEISHWDVKVEMEELTRSKGCILCGSMSNRVAHQHHPKSRS